MFPGLGVTLIAVILAAFWIANGANGLVKHDVPYVYIKANEVVLMRDGRATARQAGKFGADANLRDNLAWTHNGRYFAILEGNDEYGDTSTRDLFVFDTQADRIRKVRCPDCTSLAPIGEQQLIIGQRAQEVLDSTVTRTRILRLDLDSTQPPTLIQTNLPKLTSDMRIVAGAQGIEHRVMQCPADTLALPGSPYLDLGQGERARAVLIKEAGRRCRTEPIPPGRACGQGVAEDEAHQLVFVLGDQQSS